MGTIKNKLQFIGFSVILLIVFSGFAYGIQEDPDLEPAVIHSVEVTPDQFVCSYDGSESDLNKDIRILVDASDNVGLASVMADFSSINPELSQVDLWYNEEIGLWETTVLLGSTEGYNFEVVTIPISADDTSENGFVSDEGVDPNAYVTLYSMNTPPVSSECQRSGERATNFCNLEDFSNVNFVHEVEQYGSAECNNGQEMPWGNEYQKVITLEFESLNFLDPSIGEKLNNLRNAINVYIAPPGQFGDSYISVDSAAFAELNTESTVSLYGLPFSSVPEILTPSEERTAEINDIIINDPYEINYEECYNSFGELCNPEEEEDCSCETTTQYIPNTDITFIVNGFSQYDLTDNVEPEVTINDIEDNSMVTEETLEFNADFDGTGTQLSIIQVLLDGETVSEIEWAEIFTECGNNDDSWSEVTCPLTLEGLTEGEHTLTVSATDLGGEDGNTRSAEKTFTVDFTSPSVSISNPEDNIWLNTKQIALEFTPADNLDNQISCDISVTDEDEEEISIETLTDLESEVLVNHPISLEEYEDGTYYLTVECTDDAENSNSNIITLNIDTVNPETVLNSENYDLEELPFTTDSVDLWFDYIEYGSGVDQTLYCIDTENTCELTEIYPGEGLITVTEDNSYFRYQSIDTAGNEEEVNSVHLNIDTTGPDYMYTLVTPKELDQESILKVTTKIKDELVGLSENNPTMGVYTKIEPRTDITTARSKRDLVKEIEEIAVDGNIFTGTTSLEEIESGEYTLILYIEDSLGNGREVSYDLIILDTAKITEEFLSNSVNLEYNEITTVESSDLNIDLDINSTFTRTTSVYMTKSNSTSITASTGIPELGIFITIDAPELEDSMNYAIIKVRYTDEEVTAKNIDETTLRLWYYNEDTELWEKYDGENGGVDTTNDYIWAKTTHFSTWGVYGNTKSVSAGSSNGGGGGRRSSKTSITTPITQTTETTNTQNLEQNSNTENVVEPAPTQEVRSTEIPVESGNKLTGFSVLQNVGKTVISSKITYIIIVALAGLGLVYGFNRRSSKKN